MSRISRHEVFQKLLVNILGSFCTVKITLETAQVLHATMQMKKSSWAGKSQPKIVQGSVVASGGWSHAAVDITG